MSKDKAPRRCIRRLSLAGVVVGVAGLRNDSKYVHFKARSVATSARNSRCISSPFRQVTPAQSLKSYFAFIIARASASQAADRVKNRRPAVGAKNAFA